MMIMNDYNNNDYAPFLLPEVSEHPRQRLATSA